MRSLAGTIRQDEARRRQAQYREMALAPRREMRKWRRHFCILVLFNLIVLIGVAIALLEGHHA